jgi:Holliday junction resolvase RusA-like endonuclease
MSQRYRAHLRQLSAQIKQACGDWDPSAVRIYAIIRKPIHPTSRRYGDVDNLAKTLLEALPFDDSRVVDLQVVKRHAPVASADILLQEVRDGDY